jgi:hypothetical protein
MRTTIIKTAQPVLFATMIAASGIALSPFVLEIPAMARGGGGGGGGDGGGGGGDGAGSGAGHTGIYAVLQYDAAARGGHPPTHPPRGRAVAERGDHGGTECGTRAIRVVYDRTGTPVRYLCMATR